MAGISHELNSPVGAINSMHDTLIRAIDKLKEALSKASSRECEENRTIQSGFDATDSRVEMEFGLSTDYHIIQEHQGEIEVESEVGEGTEVTIRLPTKKSDVVSLTTQDMRHRDGGDRGRVFL